LSPEVGDTTTIGVVYTPRFLDGFQASIDWYQIELTDAITNLGAQRVTDLCIEYGTLCDRVTFASPSDITRVDAGQSNIGVLDISGFDFGASYGTALGAGQLSLRFLVSRQNQYRVQENQFIPEIDYAGQSGGVIAGGYFPAPEWMGNLMMGYSTDRFNATATVRHVGDGIFDVDRI